MKNKRKIFILSGLFLALFGLILGINYKPSSDVVHATDEVLIVKAGDNIVSHEHSGEEFDDGKLPLGKVGVPYNVQMVAQGGSGSYTWSIPAGKLAEGLSLDPDTGLISGTPTGVIIGSVYINVVDKLDPENYDNVSLSEVVYDDSWIPTIKTEKLEGAIVSNSVYYNQTIESTIGSAAYNNEWTLVSGELPPGIALGKDGTWDGSLYGYPTTAGEYTFTLKVENQFGFSTKEFTLVVEEKLTISYPQDHYYAKDTVQLTASIGNDNVNWYLYGTYEEGTSIDQSGLLTLGVGDYCVTVMAKSKTNDNNYAFADIYFDPKEAYGITVIDGVARDKTDSYTITRAAKDETVRVIAAEKDGKIFKNWTVESPDVVVYFNDPNYYEATFYMPDKPVIIKANYETIVDELIATIEAPVAGEFINFKIVAGNSSYTATLVNVTHNGETHPYSEPYVAGEDYVYEVAFKAADGYKFVYVDELSVKINGITSQYPDDFNISCNFRVTLTATEKEGERYKVSVTKGATDIIAAKVDETVTITANDAEKGYVFDKWVSSDVEVEDVNNPVTTFKMPAKDVSITATYKEVGQTTVTFDANGGTGEMAPEKVNVGSNYTLPTCTIVGPSNKEFKCWLVYGEEKNPGEVVKIDGETTIKAIWKNSEYVISFAANGGTGTMLSVETTKGSEYTLPACGFTAPEGKEFNVWQIKENKVNPGDKIIVNEDVLVTATWKDIPAYTIAFDDNGGTGTIAPQQIQKGDEFTLPECTLTAPEGKEFKCWEVNGVEMNPGAKFVVGENTTIKAVWQDAPQPAAGLSGGAIAGIVIGSTLVAGIGGFALVWFVIKKKSWADFIALFKRNK